MSFHRSDERMSRATARLRLAMQRAGVAWMVVASGECWLLECEAAQAAAKGDMKLLINDETELRAQATNVNVYGPRATFVACAPNASEERLAGKHTPAIADKKREQGELSRRGDDGATLHPHLVGHEVDDELAHFHELLA